MTWKIYFAHPHSKKDHIFKKCIVKYLESYNCEVIDPFEKKEEDESGDKIWKANRKLIRECDEVFAWIPNRDVFGVIAEIEYTVNLHQHKPLVIVSGVSHPYLDWISATYEPVRTEEELIRELMNNDICYY